MPAKQRATVFTEKMPLLPFWRIPHDFKKHSKIRVSPSLRRRNVLSLAQNAGTLPAPWRTTRLGRKTGLIMEMDRKNHRIQTNPPARMRSWNREDIGPSYAVGK